jgi:hypothetical protein
MNGRRRPVVLAVLPLTGLLGLLFTPLLGCDLPRHHSHASDSSGYYGDRDSDEQRELAAHQREEQRALDREQDSRNRSWWPFGR